MVPTVVCVSPIRAIQYTDICGKSRVKIFSDKRKFVRHKNYASWEIVDPLTDSSYVEYKSYLDESAVYYACADRICNSQSDLGDGDFAYSGSNSVSASLESKPLDTWYYYCHENIVPKHLLLPCRKCLSCRKDNARQWMIRGHHELLSHNNKGMMLNLTYDSENLPEGGNLEFRDLTLFFKRFRQFIKRKMKLNIKIKYLACGEYGENYGRPHYHAVIFGLSKEDFDKFDPLDFSYDTKADDKVYLKRCAKRGKHPLFISKSISQIWNKGLVKIGSATVASVGYIAQYITKKLSIKDYVKLVPEGIRVSQGFGKDYCLKYWQDFVKIEKDQVIKAEILAFTGKSGRISKFPIPNYYLKLIERVNSRVFELLKESRAFFASQKPPDYFYRLKLKLNYLKEFYGSPNKVRL